MYHKGSFYKHEDGMVIQITDVFDTSTYINKLWPDRKFDVYYVVVAVSENYNKVNNENKYNGCKGRFNTYVDTKFSCSITYLSPEELEIELADCKYFKKEQDMKLENLKVGMVVEFRNGEKGLLIESVDSEKMFLREFNLNANFNFYNDMIAKFDNDFDIMKVFGIKYFRGIDGIFKDENLKLLWERKEVREMTIEQISQELGYEVKVVKG